MVIKNSQGTRGSGAENARPGPRSRLHQAGLAQLRRKTAPHAAPGLASTQVIVEDWGKKSGIGSCPP
jgi:hypothetical protein